MLVLVLVLVGSSFRQANNPQLKPHQGRDVE